MIRKTISIARTLSFNTYANTDESVKATARDFLLSEVGEKRREFASEYNISKDDISILEDTMRISVERLPDRLR